MINDFQIFPKLTVAERFKIHMLDTLACRYVDLLYFFEYMIAPKAFRKFLINQNFVKQVDIAIVMKKLNLYVQYQESQSSFIRDGLTKLDYESVLNV